MVGRPFKITPDILAKLEECFLKGHSDEEACIINEIDPATLYRYCQSHPNFASKKELLKNNPKLIARRNIFKRLEEGDAEFSKWYLERKAKDEFSTKQEVLQTIDPEEVASRKSMDRIAASLDAICQNK